MKTGRMSRIEATATRQLTVSQSTEHTNAIVNSDASLRIIVVKTGW